MAEVALAIGAFVSLTSTVIGVASANKAANKAEKIAEGNAQLLEKQAGQIEARTADDIRMLQEQGGELKSAQNRAFALAGAGVDSGSAMTVGKTTDDRLTRDIEKIKQQSMFDQENLLEQARLTRETGEVQASNIRSQSYADLLSGATSFIGDMYDTGIFNNSGGSRVGRPRKLRPSTTGPYGAYSY